MITKKLSTTQPFFRWERLNSKYVQGVLSYVVSLVIFRRHTVRLITKQIIFDFQSVLESLPGVDPQSEAVRQVVRTMTTGENKDGKGGDEKKQDDKDKKWNDKPATHIGSHQTTY